MDPTAQANPQAATPTPAPATAPTASSTPAAEPVTPVVPLKRKQFLPNLPVILGFIVIFFLGIGFEKFHVMSYFKSIPLPRVSVSMPTPTPKQKQKTTKKITDTPTPSLNPTADWKTYTSDTYGFTFKYPSSATYKNTNYTGSKMSVTFNNLTSSQNTDLTVFVGTTWAFTNPKADTTKNATVAGIPTYREDIPSGQNPPQTDLYIKHGNDYITIQLVKDDKDTQIDSVLNEMLSTFQFTSSMTKPPTATGSAQK